MSNDTTQDFQLPLPNFGDERRKYTFYAIVNTVTGKQYVGLSTDYRHRKNQHLSELRHGQHKNIHLQRSYDKHGVSSFEWDVIERGVYNTNDALQREIHWIAYYNSFHDGYNLTPGGDGWNAKKCEWNGVSFDSIQECATFFDVSAATMHRRFLAGYTGDNDLPTVNHRAQKCTWNGIEFESHTAAARHLGISEKSMGYRLEQGYTCDDDLIDCRTPCEIDGVKYDSLAHAAKALGISTSSVNRRKNGNYNPRAHQYVACVWNAIEYPSVTEAAIANGVAVNTMCQRLAKGYTCDDDLPKRPYKRK